MSEPTSPAGWAAIIVALLLPAATTWAVISNANHRRSEADVRFQVGIQRQLDSQARELEELRTTVESQAVELRQQDREIEILSEAFDDPS